MATLYSRFPREPLFKENPSHLDYIVFKVERCLFTVPRHPFETESSVFKDMFSLPLGDIADSEVDGTSDERPLSLEGIRAEDFRCLLQVMFSAPSISTLQFSQWLAVLRLSHMWNFCHIRTMAIKKLTDWLQNDPILRIELASLYDIPSWLIPACRQLVMRDVPLAPDEVDRLGVDFACKLGQVREIRFSWQIDRMLRDKCQHCKSLPFLSPAERHANIMAEGALDVVVDSAILSVFGLQVSGYAECHLSPLDRYCHS